MATVRGCRAWRRILCCLATVAVGVVLVSSMLRAATAPSDLPPLSDTTSQVQPIQPIPPPGPLDPARVALGQALFNDPQLSHGNDRACASCHDTATNGADARARDVAPSGQPIAINTDTVFNAALSFRLNWLGDARTLEGQAAGALQRPDIMATTPDEVIAKLRANRRLAAQFRRAYGRNPNWTDLLNAIAIYERTLVTPDSRFDRWLLGQTDALSAQERAGYRLFTSAGCAACHQGVNVGGNLFESNGVFGSLLKESTITMRVPSLRNVAVTPPYFHDGSVADLGEAVQMMARAQLGRRFSEVETEEIVAFLQTLTGRYDGHLLTRAKP